MFELIVELFESVIDLRLLSNREIGQQSIGRGDEGAEDAIMQRSPARGQCHLNFSTVLGI